MSTAITISQERTLPETGWELLDHHPLPTWIVRPGDFQILYGNLAAGRLYGGPATGFLDYFSEESRVRFFQQATAPGCASWSAQYIHRRVGGEAIAVSLYAAMIGYEGQQVFQVSVVDTTEMRDEMSFLQEEIRRYRTFVEQSFEGIYCQEFRKPMPVNLPVDESVEWSREYSYISECNDAMARMYGFEKAKELEGAPASQLLDFDDPANIEFLKSFITNGFRVVNAESHEKDRFGNSKYFVNSAIGIVENGALVRVWGIQQDITERKKIFEQFRLMANLVEQTSDVLTAGDIHWRPVTWNQAAERIYGLKAEQVLGRDLREFINIEYIDHTREEVRECIGREGEWRGESAFVRPTDGKTITLWMSFKQLHDEQGALLGYLISATDITERKEIEQRVKESESRFRDVANSAPVMIWMCDDENVTTYLSRKWVDFTGKDITGTNEGWASFVLPEDLAAAKEQYDRAFARREPVTLTYRLRRADGSFGWVQDVSIPRFDSEGVFIGYIGSVVDIEEQKQREAQLRYQATVLENVSDIIMTTDLEFRVKAWNKSAENFYNMTEEEVRGCRLPDLAQFQFQNSNIHDALSILISQGKWEGEVSVANDQGEPNYFLYTVTYVYDEQGVKIGFLAVGRNITERKKIEAKLQESEQFYRALTADSLDATLLLNEQGAITYSSPSVIRLLGYQPEEVVGRNAFDFVHTEDLLWAVDSFNREKAENPELKSISVRLKTKSEAWTWCMIRGHNQLHNPYLNSVVLYIHDDNMRKQASQALKESEKRFRNLIRDLKVGVLLQDAEGKIVMCNNAMEHLFGENEAGLIGTRIWDRFPDVVHEDGTPFRLEERPSYRAIHEKQIVRDVVMGVWNPMIGDRVWILTTVDPVYNVEGALLHLVCSFTDITERKKLEQKLLSEQITHQRQLTQATIDGQEKERREIGQELHDNIGQQLTTIKLFLDLARSTADDATNEMVSMALKGVSDVINEVRTMSRSLVPYTLKDLGLVDSIVELTDSLMRMQVLQIKLDDKCFEERLLPENQKLTLFRIVQEQLNNIVKHASATQVEIVLRTGEAVFLSITDNGKGFHPQTIQKGLGFKNIFNRAELFGGQAELRSAPGQGCRLQVTLPAGGGQA